MPKSLVKTAERSTPKRLVPKYTPTSPGSAGCSPLLDPHRSVLPTWQRRPRAIPSAAIATDDTVGQHLAVEAFAPGAALHERHHALSRTVAPGPGFAVEHNELCCGACR
jgi:hypothetical protein